MLITKLKMSYFGRFCEKEIELQPGINLIYGQNEAGKTTLHTFIKGMLFGIERLRGRGAASKEDVYTRYLPWSYPGAYGGSMDIEVGDRKYRLTRSFHANDKSFTVTDLSTGREVKLREGLISELIPGLTESTFRNTVSIEQLKAQTDTELAAQVRNYIANLSVAKSKEVNVAKAVSTLNEQRKQLEPTLSTTALKALQTEIEEGLAREERIDQLTLQLHERQQQEQELASRREALTASLDHEAVERMNQLPAILEKYRTYQELTRQATQAEMQEEELKRRITAGERAQISMDKLKEDKRLAEVLTAEITEKDRQLGELHNEYKLKKQPGARNGLLTLLPGITIAGIAMEASGASLVGILLAAVAVLSGMTGFILLQRKNRRTYEQYQTEAKELQQRMILDRNNLNDIFTRNQAESIIALEGKLEKVQKEFYALESVREQLKDVENRKNALDDSRDSVYEVIMKYMQYFLPKEELTQESMQQLQEVIRIKKQENSGQLEALNTQSENCRLAIEKLRWEISSLESNEEQLLRNQERYQNLVQTQKENSIELEAIKLALSSIQELSSDIHDSFGQQLNQAVSEIIFEVTGERYGDLKIDEKLGVKVGWNGEYVLLDRLSAGTIDQVYFALRMAVADLLLGTDEVPLLLDDSFALYDDIRVRAALKQISTRRQILLFTCHKREKGILEEMGISYHMVDLS
jgi:uncharacterized protein YhaN